MIMTGDKGATMLPPLMLHLQTLPTPSKPDGLLIIPLVLHHLTPNYILLSLELEPFLLPSCHQRTPASLHAAACFHTTFTRQSSGQKLAVVNCFWVIQVSVLVVGTLATLMGLTVADSVYSLFALCSDLVYVVLFPQLCCVTYVPHTNTYGSLAGYVLGLVLRVLEGEPVIGLQPTIKYPYYPDVHDQMFPFRTLLAMACSFVDIVVVSYLMRYLFKKEILPMSMDFPHCFRDYDLKHHEKPKKC